MLVHPHNVCPRSGWTLKGNFTQDSLSVWCELCKCKLDEMPEPAEEVVTSSSTSSSDDSSSDDSAVSLPSFDFGNTENSSGGSFGGGEFGGGGSSSDW